MQRQQSIYTFDLLKKLQYFFKHTFILYQKIFIENFLTLQLNNKEKIWKMLA